MLTRVLASALALVLVASGGASAAALDSVRGLAPSKDLSPPEVVRAQLAALSHNGRLGENRGIEVVFRFASPANRAATGPLPRFVRMVEAGYDAMLDHTSAELGPIEMEATQATQVVFLEARDGSRHAYVFVLGLQDSGALRGCWMTDAVMELDLGDKGRGEGEDPSREAI